MVEHKAGDQQIRVSNPGPASVFLLKYEIVISQDANYNFISTYQFNLG